MKQNAIYQMHPFVADDNEEPKEGWIFLDELPDWWQSMSFCFVLFSKEQPDEIQIKLSAYQEDREEIVSAAKVADKTYRYKDLTLTLLEYREEGNAMSLKDMTDHPFYVGKHNFPKDQQIHWQVRFSSRDLDHLFDQERMILIGLSPED